MERKFHKGDKIRVIRYTVEVCGIKMEVEGFGGTVLNEYVNKDGKSYVNLYGEGNKSGNRIVPKEYVFFEEEDARGLAFDGESYTIQCCECGKSRAVKPQHASQVTRCKECQDKRNIMMARSRARKRYQNEKGTV